MDSWQIQAIQNADWEGIKKELLTYAIKWVRRYRWRTGDFLPKGLEPSDLAMVAIVKTLNEEVTWNRKSYPELIDFLKATVKTLVRNLHKHRIHKKTNYSAELNHFEASELAIKQIDETIHESWTAEVMIEESESEEERKQDAQISKEIIADLLSYFEGKNDTIAYMTLSTYQDLIKDETRPKPAIIAEKLGCDVREIYMALKRIRTRVNSLKNRLLSGGVK